MSERTRPRLELTVEWIVWHAVELAGVTVPLVLAAWLTWWFVVASALVAAGWGVHEWRGHRAQARLQAAAEARQVLATPVKEAQADDDGPATAPLPEQGHENRSAR